MRSSLPRGQVGAAGDGAGRAVGHDRDVVDACLAVLNPHGAVEGADRRAPAGQALLGPGDEVRDVVDGVEFGECADLAADRRQVHILDGAAARGQRHAAGEAADHRARRLPAHCDVAVERGAAGDRIDPGGLQQDGAHVRAAEPERRLPGRHGPAGEAAVGFQRAVEEPAAQRLERQRPLGRGELRRGLLDAIGAEDQGFGVERERAVEPVEEAEVDRLVRPAPAPCRRVGACAAAVCRCVWRSVRRVRRRDAAAQPGEVEGVRAEVGAERRRLPVQAEEDSAAHPARAERGVDAGNVGRRRVARDAPDDVKRAEALAERGVCRRRASHAFQQGLGARVGEIDGDPVARRRERVLDPAGEFQRRAGALGVEVERDGVEIAAHPAVDRQRAQPCDDGGRREPCGAGEHGGIGRAQPDRERGCGRVEGCLDRSRQRRLGAAGVDREIDRERLPVARERALQRDGAERLGADVGIDLEKRGEVRQRSGRAFDRECHGRCRPQRARATRHREAQAGRVGHLRPVQGRVAVFQRADELQPRETHAAIGQRVDLERHIGVDPAECRPHAVARASRRRRRIR